ncbi:preprotein translocase subunit SecA [Agaribacterium haliotis]|uniref:preprotein translocase subunit SecA n=1 Tax=Agaribacterium haliotis TaxID=2013869 RepID=UPI000BB549E0|nr:preprotein translocase subunit SecA [Agaribacterium haliotis]
MINKVLKLLIGSRNDREVKRLRKLVNKINAYEPDYEKLSDDELKGLTTSFKKRVSDGESLDAILPEAFAAVREASKRAMGMRHFDVQMIGGMVLHQGRISEMRTGEGKTLVATLAAYLNALSGNGVHVVTVNDYLASRDANWMRPLYEALGLSVGVVVAMQPQQEKYDAYRCDITYGTNNEFGFDFLRDNMALRKEDRMQRGLNFAIVDEVDSILIDEARTPLIISGAAQDSSELYRVINKLVPSLEKVADSDGERNDKIMLGKIQLEGDDKPTTVPYALGRADKENKDLVIVDSQAKPPLCRLADKGHFAIDEKSRQVELSEEGHELVEQWLVKNKLMEENDSLYSAANLSLLQHVHSALKAHTLFNRNVEYIVQDNQVVLIDEHTGRTMPGRRLSEGLHQAIEAKEGVQIQAESQTLASTTFQNYFRMYQKLSGMTGTADTEAFELKHIYGLEVIVIPTNVPVARDDLNDLVFLSLDEKIDAVVNDVKELVEKNAPVLVGTASVESSELMSQRLKKGGIKHEVLNAKQHEREATIIAEAGRPGSVTIATNMAGRGTDIKLGGNLDVELEALGEGATQEQIEAVKADWQKRHETVMAAGGLHIIGTERHESRRIDNQLRGRAGRQGDPGMSRFYLSLEDNLMRIFASERMRNFMQALGMEKGEAIEHRMVTNAIEKAQRKVEARNFDYRKQLLEYDDVANDQRTVVYTQRNDLLEADDIEDIVAGIRDDVIDGVVSGYVPPQSLIEQWDVPGLEQALQVDFGVDLPVQKWLDDDEKLYEETLRKKIHEALEARYLEKSERIGSVMRSIEKQIMLQVLDTLWKEHLQNMDHLRQGIGLRAYAQKNPKQEYKREAFELFQALLENLKYDVVKVLYRVEPMTEEQMEAMEKRQREEAERQKLQLEHESKNALQADEQEVKELSADKPYVRDGRKVGRNDPCPCGSGKKYKACHGKLV